jgi:hypothetical protein
MKIKDLVTSEQYTQLKKEYTVLFKNKEITFFEFCTNTYKQKKDPLKTGLFTSTKLLKTKPLNSLSKLM